MLQVFPDYYRDFHCTAGACTHNCCIGWEIDLDEDTATRYRTVSGALGQRMQTCIHWGETPHFILGEGERCPFLNGDNLCDIILTLGEDSLCSICSDHPRFRNELPGRVETGLGLCCEEAARLILTRVEPMHLEICGTQEEADEIIALRDEVLQLLQDRCRPLPSRIQDMLDACRASLPEVSLARWTAILLALERLDDAWTEVLHLLQKAEDTADFAGFAAHMAGRETEYEQLLVYLVYRHLANAADAEDISARASFTALVCRLLYAAGAAIWTATGRFTIDDQIQLCRMFSSEIEYSDDNFYQLLMILY